ncbi:hypothetical protein AMAG_17800 [Allomyces macrogynus ATCC 38327]|uniref:Uncharacterized protein n=1 Tax=Allomyces macrogynus (strain ATCC 38327) TaxID=578462 RepID=A0A0L0RZY7_ALLM3|nr:hypothetical protein AMAG_17800 [Allomyces macrogynus ATCC 38327]|eukprot:KNE55671.1 hypothetical protein AMAG_17800 [Allomyces macrogynus ATCC 38327]
MAEHIQTVEAQLQASRDQQATTESTAEQLHHELQEVNGRVAELEAARDRLLGLVEQMQEEHTETARDYDGKVAALESNVADLEASLAGRVAQVADLELQVHELQSQGRALQEEYQCVVANRDQLQEQVASLDVQLRQGTEREQSTVSALRTQLSNLEAEATRHVERLQQQLAAAQQEAADTQQRLDQAQAELEAVTTNLKATHGTLSAEARSLRDALAHYRMLLREVFAKLDAERDAREKVEWELKHKDALRVADDDPAVREYERYLKQLAEYELRVALELAVSASHMLPLVAEQVVDERNSAADERMFVVLLDTSACGRVDGPGRR